MADVQKQMQDLLDEHRKKYPDKAFRFVDADPKVLPDRINDGWQPVKNATATAGTSGEIRVGDSILAARPRKEDDEERASQARKTQAQVNAPLAQYYEALERSGGRGGTKYLKPLTPAALEGDGRTWSGGGNK